MKIKLIGLFVLSLSLVACQSTMTRQADNQTLLNPNGSHSRMIFMRTTMFGGAIQSSVYDVTDGEIKFIGIVSAKTRLIYDVPPGNYMFMVVAENADFMAAEMVGGKTYRSIITPRYGIWKARFSLHPVRKDGSSKHSLHAKHIQSGNKHPIVVNKPEAQQWFKRNKQNIHSKYSRYWPKWVAKPEPHKAKRTVFASDGI